MRREFFAEFLGTLVLMVFGLGVNAQVTLGADKFGTFFSVNAGWGIAVMLGVYTAGKVTGGHLNPAVTLAMFVRGRLPASRVFPYMAAQLLAAVLASVIVYEVYVEQITHVEKEAVSTAETAKYTMATGGIWGTYPRKFADNAYVSNVTGLMDQILGTAMLLLCVCALTDDKNLAPMSNMAPLAVGAIVFMVGMSFGSNCGYAINPARDFGPRLFSAMAGWGGQVFQTPNSFWWLMPILGPFVGGIAGVTLYDQCISRFHPSEDDAKGTQGS